MLALDLKHWVQVGLVMVEGGGGGNTWKSPKEARGVQEEGGGVRAELSVPTHMRVVVNHGFFVFIYDFFP